MVHAHLCSGLKRNVVSHSLYQLVRHHHGMHLRQSIEVELEETCVTQSFLLHNPPLVVPSRPVRFSVRLEIEVLELDCVHVTGAHQHHVSLSDLIVTNQDPVLESAVMLPRADEKGIDQLLLAACILERSKHLSVFFVFLRIRDLRPCLTTGLIHAFTTWGT